MDQVSNDPRSSNFVFIILSEIKLRALIYEIMLANEEKKKDKKLTTLGIPRRSPIQVLTEPDVA